MALSARLTAEGWNRLLIRLGNWDIREHRQRFDNWIVIPLLGLAIGMVPNLVEYLAETYDPITAFNGLALAALVVVLFGGFFGVARWRTPKGEFTDFRAFEPLYESVAARDIDTLNAQEIADVQANYQTLKRELKDKYPIRARALAEERLSGRDSWLTAKRVVGTQDLPTKWHARIRDLSRDFGPNIKWHSAALGFVFIATLGTALLAVVTHQLPPLTSWAVHLISFVVVLALQQGTLMRQADFAIKACARELDFEQRLSTLLESRTSRNEPSRPDKPLLCRIFWRRGWVLRDPI